MKLVHGSLLALFALVTPCLGQQRPEPIIIPASPSPSSTATQSCVEVEIGGEKSSSLKCLNQQLKRQVDQVAPTVNAPPVDAHSQDIHVGVVNVPAVEQQYGPNFGRSVVPYRPQNVFVSPLNAHR